MFEDPQVSAAEAHAQIEISRRSIDDWLSRMILAVLAGDGAGLIALANSSTIVQGALWLRLLGLVIVVCFLFGVATSFLALASRRTFYISREVMFSKRLRKMEVEDRLRAAGEDEFLGLMEDDLRSAASFANDCKFETDRYLTKAMWATVLGVGLMVGVLLFAPGPKPPIRNALSGTTAAPPPAVMPAADSTSPSLALSRRCPRSRTVDVVAAPKGSGSVKASP